MTTPEGIEAEPHPLWEYHSCARSKIHRLMTFDFSENIQGKSLYEVDGEIILNKQSGPCNGVVLWLDYTFQEDTVISTGLLSQSVRHSKHYLYLKSNSLIMIEGNMRFVNPKKRGQSPRFEGLISHSLGIGL